MPTSLPIPPAVICLAGPTGAGKSAAALHLAACLDAEIINADSRQVYRDFPLITAQPGPDDLARAPHHLYGFLDTQARISAGRWAEMARATVARTLAAGRLPLVVGGTGLYMRALFDGMADIPPVPDTVRAAITADCAARGLPAMHHRLCAEDPACAARIHPNDRQRILRALEVRAATGKPLSWWQTTRTPEGPQWRVLHLGLGLPLDALTPLLDQRINAMLASGALAEARHALALCPDRTAPGWSGIGCAELFAHLHHEIDAMELRRLWLANTRAYAKRQWTWFRADARIRWFTPTALAEIEQAARDFLAAPAHLPQPGS